MRILIISNFFFQLDPRFHESQYFCSMYYIYRQGRVHRHVKSKFMFSQVFLRLRPPFYQELSLLNSLSICYALCYPVRLAVARVGL